MKQIAILLKALRAELSTPKNLWCVIIAGLLVLVFGLKLEITFPLFPVLLMALIVLAFFKKEGKHDWWAVASTLIGGLIALLFTL